MRSLAVFLASSLPVFTVLASCGSGGRRTPNLTTPPVTALRAVGVDTDGGESDLLAAQLLVAAGTPIQFGGRPTFRVRAASLEERLVFHAVAHVEASSLGAGALGGASIDGSSRIRRLAALPNAPVDSNGNGTNLDEVAAAEVAYLAEFAGDPGTALPSYGSMMPWRASTAAFVDTVAGRDDFAAMRVAASVRASAQVDAGQLGGAMLARLHAAAWLLEEGRGIRPGRDARAGKVGLLFLQQVLALEETMVGSLFGRDGSLAGLRDARTYDPASAADALWVPARLQVGEETGLTGAPATYAVLDRASSLHGLATLLEAASELAWFASPRNGNPALRDVLNGFPLGPLPDRRRGRGSNVPSGNDEVTFSREIRPILAANCIACHNDSSMTSGYTMGPILPQAVVEYEKVIAGGNVGRRGSPPNVVSGNHAGSLLWQVLLGPAAGVRRMPQGCGSQFYPCLPAGQISLVADWIDQGLLRDPSEPQPPPKIGEDLARVLLKNLRLLHAEGDGALADRFDGEASSRVYSSASTGAALSALASAAMALPDAEDARALLAGAAAFAAAKLIDAQGEVVGELVGDDRDRRTANGPADAVAHATLVAGLFAAARVVSDDDVLARARAGAAAWLRHFWIDSEALFRSHAGDDRLAARAGDLAVVLRAVQEMAAAGVAGAAEVHDALVERLLPIVVASEWDGQGEVLDDGIADTDGDGIAEPALAGGAFGRAPLLLGEVRFGADPDLETLPVSWSQTVAPLFRSACAGCHVDGAARGDYRVDSVTAAKRAGESGRTGELIVPGDPEASLLYRKLVDRRPPVGEQMPLQRPPLDDKARALVRRWILEGAVDR
ncbi:MAG: c-type cytochrome domain-containing protein [Planctomycetota bacterium]